MTQLTTAADERSNETAIESAEVDRSVRVGAYLIALSGVGFVANGAAMLYRVFYSAGFEAGVDTLGGATKADLAATNPEVLHYIDHLHVNVAGLMVAGGIAVVALAWFGVRRGRGWALVTAIALPAVFLVHSIPIHGAAGFSFDALVHLGPGLVWLPALIVGGALAGKGLYSTGGSPDGREPATDDGRESRRSGD